MKYLSVIIILGLSLYASEIDRMEAMVGDIEKLRADYSECKKELDKQTLNNIIPFGELENSLKRDIVQKNKTIKEYKKRLDKEMVKNTTLTAEIDTLRKENNSDKLFKHLNKVLKTKEKEIENLKNEITELKKAKENDNNSLILVKKDDSACVEENQFPKLVMKDSIKENEIINEKKSTTKKENLKEIAKTIKASAFRLKVDSDIYDSINGNIVYNWDSGTSFTSYLVTKNWVKITGYFNDGKWGRAKEELWIKKVNTIKR